MHGSSGEVGFATEHRHPSKFVLGDLFLAGPLNIYKLRCDILSGPYFCHILKNLSIRSIFKRHNGRETENYQFKTLLAKVSGESDAQFGKC